MNDTRKMIKTTMIGGVIFLIPLVVIAAILGKAFKLMLVVAHPLDKWISLDQVGGIALVNILAILILLSACFVAGLAARSSWGKRIFTSLDSKLILIFPGYAFVKGMASGHTEEDQDHPLIPVLAKLDDSTQIGFEVDRTDQGDVIIFLPGAPNPWSGTVVLMDESRVEPLDQTMMSSVQQIRRLGRGLAIPPGLKATYKMNAD